MYGEGKSNYFKGSILILSYLAVIVGFYFSSFNSPQASVMNVNNVDTLSLGISPLSPSWRAMRDRGFVERR
jgi:Ca2+:H+ antiporter